MFPEFFKQTVETFETKYPLLVGIFVEPWEREKLMDNKDFEHKYITNNAIIKTFIFELEKRFDKETVKKIVEDTVLKLPANLLVSFVTSYLNSDEATKSNADVVSYFNKTVNLNVKTKECINYITENGIVANRGYKNLPNIVIDDKYNQIKSDEYVYHQGREVIKLDDIYNTLSYSERSLVIDLIEHESFNLLDVIFDRFDYSLKSLLTILDSLNIDSKIINNEVVEILTQYFTMLLILLIMEAPNPLDSVRNINLLIETKRFDLLKYLICYSLIGDIAELKEEEITSLNDEQIKAKFKIDTIGLYKKED